MAAAKVWHIVDYEKLFFATQTGKPIELEAVQYTPRHIAAPWDDPVRQVHINRMTELRSTLKAGDYLAAKELYENLLDRSQLMHKGPDKYLRGYVVDANLKPLPAARIGLVTWMPLTPAEGKRLLTLLERAGLIEQTAMPDRPAAGPTEDEPGPLTPDPLPEDNPAARAKAAQKYRRKPAQKTHQPAAVAPDKNRKPPKTHDLIDVASQSRVSRESVATEADKNKNKNSKEKPKPTLGLSASVEPEKETFGLSAEGGEGGNRPLTRDTDRGRGTPTAEAEPRSADRDETGRNGMKATGDGLNRPLTREPKAEPDETRDRDGPPVGVQEIRKATPTADAGGGTGGEREHRDAGQGRDSPDEPSGPKETEVSEGPDTLRAAQERLLARQAEIARQRQEGRQQAVERVGGYAYAEQVYAALQVPYGRDTPQGRAEIEAFVTAYQRAMGGVPQGQVEMLRSKGLRSAFRLGNNRGRRQYRNVSAIWISEFGRRASSVAASVSHAECKVL